MGRGKRREGTATRREAGSQAGTLMPRRGTKGSRTIRQRCPTFCFDSLAKIVSGKHLNNPAAAVTDVPPLACPHPLAVPAHLAIQQTLPLRLVNLPPIKLGDMDASTLLEDQLSQVAEIMEADQLPLAYSDLIGQCIQQGANGVVKVEKNIQLAGPSAGPGTWAEVAVRGVPVVMGQAASGNQGGSGVGVGGGGGGWGGQAQGSGWGGQGQGQGQAGGGWGGTQAGDWGGGSLGGGGGVDTFMSGFEPSGWAGAGAGQGQSQSGWGGAGGQHAGWGA